MNGPRNRAATARMMADAAIARGDPNGWFEELYASARQGAAWVPWAELAPNPHLVSWAALREPDGDGQRALVVGCGLGDDAEYVADLGFAVTAFDVAPTAVAEAISRFPGTAVNYVVADALSPPPDWHGRYDLVIEAYTLQVHRGEARRAAIRQIAGMVAPGGTLLVIARARADDDEFTQMPWPLTRAEALSFASGDLRLVRIDDVPEGEPPGRRWRAEFRRG
jgi:SAM-dependent methyltransferase